MAKNGLHSKGVPAHPPLRFRYHRTESERLLHQGREPYSWAYMLPASVFIAPIGLMWGKGCWEKVVQMMEYTNACGFNCWMEEIPDPLLRDPYVSIPGMLDHGVLKGVNSGAESVCLVHNDARPAPDLLLKLLQCEEQIIAPRIIDHNGQPMGMPKYEANQGVQKMLVIPTTFMLIRANVFNAVGITPFSSAELEDVMWEKFWFYGHRPYLNTDLTLEVASHTTRFSVLNLAAKVKFFKQVDAKRRSVPDRKPTDPADKRQVYYPAEVTEVRLVNE